MAQNAVTGPKDEPQFAETGAPEIGTDLTILGAFAALVGNRKVGTAAQRMALTGKKVWEGLAHQDTDGTKGEYVYKAGAWAAVIEDTGWINFTATAGSAQGVAGSLGGSWTASPPFDSPGYKRQNGLGLVRGFIAAGQNNTMFTLPPFFRPAGISVRTFVGTAGGQSGALCYLNANGTCIIQGYYGGASNAGLDINMTFALA